MNVRKLSLHYVVKYKKIRKMESSEICSVINDQSRGTTAKHLSSDWLHHYKFIIQFAGEKKLKSAKWLIVIIV